MTHIAVLRAVWTDWYSRKRCSYHKQNPGAALLRGLFALSRLLPGRRRHVSDRGPLAGWGGGARGVTAWAGQRAGALPVTLQCHVSWYYLVYSDSCRVSLTGKSHVKCQLQRNSAMLSCKVNPVVEKKQ